MNEQSKFKVSVWGAFIPEFELIMSADEMSVDSNKPAVHVISEESSGLWKELFSWIMLEDAFGGVIEINDRDRLKEALIEKMAIAVHPSKRTIDSLKSFVNDASSVLSNGGVEWSGTQSSLTEDDDEIRLNPLLALVNHLSWIITVFDGQPNISVSIK